jgi:serine/threonine protein kinase
MLLETFPNDFDKWTSGNITIDKFIQDAQINADNRSEVILWIPYDRFKDIKEIAKGGFGTIYKAEWIDGYALSWEVENKQWFRFGQSTIALKKFNNNFTNLNEDFLNEVKYLLISNV